MALPVLALSLETINTAIKAPSGEQSQAQIAGLVFVRRESWSRIHKTDLEQLLQYSTIPL